MLFEVPWFGSPDAISLSPLFLCSLLGLGYKLNDLLKSSEEIAKIRKSREANMKGRFDTFMKVFNLTVNKPKTKPVAVAAKVG